MHTTWKSIVTLAGAVLVGSLSGCESDDSDRSGAENVSHYWEILLDDRGKEPASVTKSVKTVSRKHDSTAGGNGTWAAGGSHNASKKFDTAGATYFAGSAGWDTGGTSSIPPNPEPSRWCDWRDCSEVPLALWHFDDCNAQSSALADSAPYYYYSYYYYGAHPAFRAVSASCVEGIRSQGIRLAVPDDVIYSPDQPDYDFTQGFTIAMWVKADAVTGTETLARKRLDESSAMALVIENGSINFVIRMSDGRPYGVSAPMQAGVETHVAATHDGDMIRLFVNGSVVASKKAVGSIATGAGPIFLGNDAKNRLFKGLVDEVWLNNLAAPENTIKEQSCLRRRPPQLTVTPTTTPPMQPRVPVAFEATLKNMNSAGSCPVDSFTLCEYPDWMLTSDRMEPCEVVALAPGDTYTRKSNISGKDVEMLGTYLVNWYAYSWSEYGGSHYASATAEFTLEASPCLPTVVTLAPAVSEPITFGTEVPFILTIKNPNDPLMCPASLFNFWFENWWSMGTTEPGGTIGVAPGETAIREPRITVYDYYYWNSQPYEVRYRVCNEVGLKCATASSQIRILGSFTYNFDWSYDGFQFDWWTNPDPDYPLTNIVAQVPEGQSPPWMDLNYESGSPAAPSLRLTLPFTTTQQYVYLVRQEPYVDLSHKILKARVRWVSGSFATGAIQFAAWSGEDWAFGSLGVNPVTLVRGGDWQEIRLDLDAAREQTLTDEHLEQSFDPTRVVQIGVQFFSGFDGQLFVDEGPAVLEIDSVTSE